MLTACFFVQGFERERRSRRAVLQRRVQRHHRQRQSSLRSRPAANISARRQLSARWVARRADVAEVVCIPKHIAVSFS